MIEVSEKVPIVTPHISTEELDIVSPAHCVNVQHGLQRAAGHTHSTELREECVLLVSNIVRVGYNTDIRIECLQLPHSLLSSLSVHVCERILCARECVVEAVSHIYSICAPQKTAAKISRS